MSRSLLLLGLRFYWQSRGVAVLPFGDHILINVIADRIRIRITLLIPETGHL